MNLDFDGCARIDQVGGDDAEVMTVAPAVGRPTGSSPRKTAKKAVKKRKPLSPEARAGLAQNLVKARAARAGKAKAAKQSIRKRAAKKTPLLLSGATGAGVKEALRALADVIGEKPVTDKAKENAQGVADAAPWAETPTIPQT